MIGTKMFFHNPFAVVPPSSPRRWVPAPLGAVLLVLSIASLASAQVASEDPTRFGYLGQGNAGVTFVNGSLPNPPFAGGPSPFQQYSVNVQNNACVPTSTANGLSYLENYALNVLGLGNIFTTSPTNYSEVNALASSQQTFNLTNATANNGGPFTDLGGTYTTYMFNGTRSYLNGNNPAGNVKLSGQAASGTPASWIQGAYGADTNVQQNTTPSAAYLAALLDDAHNAIELTIEWGAYDESDVWTPSGGGHEVTLTSINMNAGSGFMSFIDPWGLGATAGTSGFLTTASVATSLDGYLYLTYPTILADSDHQSGEYAVGITDGSTGRIDVAMIESVPEPSTLVLAAVALSVLLRIGYHRRRSGVPN